MPVLNVDIIPVNRGNLDFSDLHFFYAYFIFDGIPNCNYLMKTIAKLYT